MFLSKFFKIFNRDSARLKNCDAMSTEKCDFPGRIFCDSSIVEKCDAPGRFFHGASSPKCDTPAEKKICSCGCGRPVNGRKLTFDSTCRKRLSRKKVKNEKST